MANTPIPTPGAGHPGAPRPALRRLAFYFGGFDPAGPAKYHALYAHEGAKQARLGRYSLEIGSRKLLSPHCAAWTIHYKDADGLEASTRHHFMRWDDLVRSEWPRSSLSVWGRCVRTGWRLVSRGRILDMARHRPSAALTLALPSLLPLLAAILTTLGLLVGVSLGSSFGWWGLLPTVAGLPLLLAAVWRAWSWSQAGWLGRSAFMILEHASGRWPALDERQSAFADFVVEQMQRHPSEEVLLIGHSSGAMLATAVAARIYQRAPEQAVSLLTLGQCIPVLSHQPDAIEYRAALNLLGSSPNLTWVDFSAPVDGCCFALSDPLVWPGGLQPKMAVAPAKVMLLSPRFYRLFTPAGYSALKGDKMRCHFQYLKAGEQLGEYDFFRLCAGPAPLRKLRA